MTTANVIWASEKTETITVVAETAHTFTTDDINQTRWWKRTGQRVGAMRYVPANLRNRAFWTQATASLTIN